MFPSMPNEDPWDAEASQQVARMTPGRQKAGVYSAVPDEEAAKPDEIEPEDDEFEEIEVVPVRAKLSAAIGGFAGLLATALIVGSLVTGPGARTSYVIVLFGVQLLGLLAWTMALQPPAAGATAGVVAVTALAADYLAATGEPGDLLPLFLTAVAGFVAAMVAQVIRAEDRQRAKDTWRTTLLIVGGVAAYAMLITLTREPLGSQAILVCCVGAGTALMIARLTDAVLPKPRIALQVPRGATGIVLGAMLGTLAASVLGSYLVYPFTPTKGAVLGLIAAVAAHLIDLAVNFGEAGRRLAGDAPTFWLARHMQGPLGGFALTAFLTYFLLHWYLT
ncbi:hypothetical protein [Actinoplanes derwentensis]|nr:hypothetical protein [Actinoplanes derwentensis]